MAYNEELVNRIREIIALTHDQVEEKKMFGGLCFMVNEKMCVGVVQEKLMVRLDPEIFDEILASEECIPMDFTGKSMKGFVFVESDLLESNKRLHFWVKLALDYNPIAKASPKKKPKSKQIKL